MPSIIDKPKKSNQLDMLETEKYTNGLVKFIQTCSTPMTIGVQGEWGSGKTSLLYTIQDELCFKDSSKYHSVWINTWEYSLLSEANETVIKIIVGMIEQISQINPNAVNESIKKLLTISKYLLDKAAKTDGAIGLLANVAADAVSNTNPGNSVKELRDTLQQAIDKALVISGKEAVIFFIDDLDRLDPTIAVNILELIKNIFDIEKCIFILAIDYSVVVKGLKSKFGEMTEQNEWEFRAFFDKIIQLPFSMPMANYNISKYLQNILVDVNYFDEKTLKNEATIEKISEIVNLSIGTNPRSLKRLANSVSLIDIIRGDKDISIEDKIIEFALICTQIAYPTIYGLIQREPDFENWTDLISQNIIKNINIDLKDLEILSELEDFNELWEQNLWKICQASTFLRDRAFLVSKLLNFIRKYIVLKNGEILGDAIERLLTMSSVTSVSCDSRIVKDKSQRDNTKYTFNGNEYGKGRLAQAVVKQFVKDHPDINYEQLESAIPKDAQGTSGVFTRLEIANNIFENTNFKRHFMKPDDIIKLQDAEIVVSNQWGATNIDKFIEHAIKLGYKII